MKDTILINKGIIKAQLSVSIEHLENSIYMGHISSFDIPFTATSKEKAVDIAQGLIKALFNQWLIKGDISYFKEKLQQYHFSPHVQGDRLRYEHVVSNHSFQINQELRVI